MTALDLPGVCLSLVLLPREAVIPPFNSSIRFDADLLLSSLDSPTEAPGWPWHYKGRPEGTIEPRPVERSLIAVEPTVNLAPSDPALFLRALEAGVKAVIAAEPEITRYDTVGGDGDAGHTLRAGGKAILALLDDDKVSQTNVIDAVVTIAGAVEESMGGTSGGFYAIFLNVLATQLAVLAQESGHEVASFAMWKRALEVSGDESGA